MALLTSDFDYQLPTHLIAQEPVEPRDRSRLLVLERASGTIRHALFQDLPEILGPSDLLVGNDSRVIPARLAAHKESGGGLELLLLRPLAADDRGAAQDVAAGADPWRWLCLIGGRVRPGTRFVLDRGAPGAETVRGTVEATFEDGQRLVAFDRDLLPLLDDLGTMPLPPYIRRPLDRPERYQTVYAARAGSAAAPTAGLHFTPRLLERLGSRGIGWETVTLHVGLDTFRPVEVERLEDHRMHQEWVELPERTLRGIVDHRRRGGRVLAVGTTSVRVLESAARASRPGPLRPFAGWTDLFLYPGASFEVVEGLITNFHLPRSSLLMLVSAFAGREAIAAAYAEAIREGYRFFSFGDAMLIL